jgi:UDP-N-acetyl-2-amino-2-deoxyglucuronate dehydrogenase
VSEIKFAIVGCGRIAQRHAEHISKMARLVAVCDTKRQRADELAAKYNCKAYGSIEEMLAQEPSVDVISICSPNGLHAEHTIKGLRAGKHVVCEKPMALRAADCRRMIEESERNAKKLFVVKQNRFNPPIAALKKAVDEGRLGNIVSVQLNCFWNRTDAYYKESDWKGSIDLDGGTLYTQFSHFVDLLIWMVGDIGDVQVLTKNFLHQSTVDFEDTGVVALEFTNGALGTINYTVNSYKKNMEGSISLFGDKGTVKIGGQYLNALEYQCIEGYEITDVAVSAPANDYGFYQGSMSNHDKVYQNVLNVLTANHEIATGGLDGLKTVEVIERIYSQANLGTRT